MTENLFVVILAGGKGTRLDPLTRYRAKPAVPIAGNNRIIDFPLTEAIVAPNILVLTQGNSFSLEKHISYHFSFHTGRNQSVQSISPQGVEWYNGTADAVLQNWEYIKREAPTRVAVLSGDHIYQRFSLQDFLRFHDEKGGDLSIASNVRPNSREQFQMIDGKLRYPFGVIEASRDGRVIGFQEKPDQNPAPIKDNPSNSLASMGIYIFNTKALKDWLDSSRPDFGKDLIPAMHEDRRPIYAYTFSGYWEDVGLLRDYYNANLALNLDNPPLDLHELSKSRKTEIMGRSYKPASRVPMCGAYSTVSEGCRIDKTARVINCVLSPGTVIGPNTTLVGCIVLGASDSDKISGECNIKNSHLERTIIDRGNYLDGVVITDGIPTQGLRPEDRGVKYVVDEEARITAIARRAYPEN